MQRATVWLCVSALALPALSGCFFNASVSSAAHDYLGAVPFTKLVFEVEYQAGKNPRGDALDLLAQRARERCNKPDGVTYTQDPFSDSRTHWTLDDLRASESAHRKSHSQGTTAVFFIQYVGGSFEADNGTQKVLGVAYGPTSLAIFKDNIDGAGAIGPLPLFSTDDVERSVVVHEFGHILGLVNFGTPMVRPHEDPDPAHAHHSSNKNSVMYWAIDSSAINQLFNGPPPTQFDQDDIADLHAAGGQ